MDDASQNPGTFGVRGGQSTLVVVLCPVKKELHKMSRGLEGLQESYSGLGVMVLHHVRVWDKPRCGHPSAVGWVLEAIKRNTFLFTHTYRPI